MDEEKKMVCPMCGYVGEKMRFSKGSYVLEMFLWCMFFVPGAVYTLWRAFNEYQACPVCRNEAMTPADGLLGKKIIAEKSRMNEAVSKKDLFETISNIMHFDRFIK